MYILYCVKQYNEVDRFELVAMEKSVKCRTVGRQETIGDFGALLNNIGKQETIGNCGTL